VRSANVKRRTSGLFLTSGARAWEVAVYRSESGYQSLAISVRRLGQNGTYRACPRSQARKSQLFRSQLQLEPPHKP